MRSSDFTETSTVSSRRRAPCEGRQPKITRNVYVVRRVLQSRQSRKTREPHPTSPKEKQQSLLLVFSKLVAFVFLAEGKEKKKKHTLSLAAGIWPSDPLASCHQPRRNLAGALAGTARKQREWHAYWQLLCSDARQRHDA